MNIAIANNLFLNGNKNSITLTEKGYVIVIAKFGNVAVHIIICEHHYEIQINGIGLKYIIYPDEYLTIEIKELIKRVLKKS